MDKNYIKKYIQKRFGDLPEKNVRAIERTIQKYGDNHWWESSDPVEIAMYQIFEPTLLVKFEIFHEGVEKLLDRPVWTHEFGLNYQELQKEAILGVARLKMGIEGISDEEKAQKIRKSISMLEDYCRKNNKPLLKYPQDFN